MKSDAIMQMITIPEKAPIPEPPESHFLIDVKPIDSEIAQ